KAESLLVALLDEKDAPVRLAAVRAIEDGRVAKAARRLTELFADRWRPAGERMAILRALRVLPDKTVVPVLKDCLHAKDTATILRTEALRTLAAVDPAEAQNVAKAFLTGSDAELQSEAVQVLGARAD